MSDQPIEETPVPYTDEEVEQARAAHAAKSDTDLAYEAGRAAESDPQARAHGVDACPFSDGPERSAWLKGFADALEEQPDIASLRRSISEASNA